MGAEEEARRSPQQSSFGILFENLESFGEISGHFHARQYFGIRPHAGDDQRGNEVRLKGGELVEYDSAAGIQANDGGGLNGALPYR